MKSITKLINFSEGIALESGKRLDAFDLMVETYGELNESKTNAILLCHAFSGNHHAAGKNEDQNIGWWDQIVGPNKAINTDEYYVVCCNNIGGCSGSSGPTSINPNTKKAYGSDFDIRIGIHYGEVIVGSVGYGEDKKLTVIGDAVNIASRIEAINKDAGTRLLVSDDAYNEIRDNVDVQNFLRLKLRGTSNLITLHEIQRVKENSLIDHDNIKEISHDNNIWTRTLPISELEEGEKKKFLSKEKEILLIKQEGIYAIENFCPHMNLPLDVGQITENGTILCPYHNSEFCFRSGEVKKWVGLKAEDAKKECEPLKIIPTLSKDSYIWVKKD